MPQVDPPPCPQVAGLVPRWSHVISWELVNKSVACTQKKNMLQHCVDTILTSLQTKKSSVLWDIWKYVSSVEDGAGGSSPNRVPLTWPGALGLPCYVHTGLLHNREEVRIVRGPAHVPDLRDGKTLLNSGMGCLGAPLFEDGKVKSLLK